MKKIIFMSAGLAFILFLLELYEAAEPADQMLVEYVGSPEKWPFGTISTTIKRINKTHQVVKPIWNLSAPFSDDLWSEVVVFRQDGGGWHPLFTRVVNQWCSAWFTKDGMMHGIKKTFLPSLPDECPFKPGFYNITPSLIPRYRKDWIPELQALIPPMVPNADKWRMDIRTFNAKNEEFQMLRYEFRLINQFSSQ